MSNTENIDNLEVEVYLEEIRQQQLKYLELLERRKIAQNKYLKSEKGKEANRKAQLKYYHIHLSTKKPVGRPRKQKRPEEIEDNKEIINNN